MKLRVPAFYRDFACIAGACPDSCCQGWEVDADPQYCFSPVRSKALSLFE